MIAAAEIYSFNRMDLQQVKVEWQPTYSPCPQEAETRNLQSELASQTSKISKL